MRTFGPLDAGQDGDRAAIVHALREEPQLVELEADGLSQEVLLVWAGEPSGLLFIAVMGKGAYSFEVRAAMTHPSYLAEKLNVTRGQGEALARVLHGLCWTPILPSNVFPIRRGG